MMHELVPWLDTLTVITASLGALLIGVLRILWTIRREQAEQDAKLADTQPTLAQGKKPWPSVLPGVPL